MINLLNNGNIETEGGDGVGKEGLALCTCIEGINIQKKMTHKTHKNNQRGRQDDVCSKNESSSWLQKEVEFYGGVTWPLRLTLITIFLCKS